MRGKAGYVPFWPGGLDGAVITESDASKRTKGLRTVPPGFARGLRLAGDVPDEDGLLIDDYSSDIERDGETGTVCCTAITRLDEAYT